ncbi:hypothetical protein PISMIDRAFT_674767 [Pisolithus microcarpus 441]|uniref:Secreted protein n=1 Tax=Pisolithus microcarpus 441 TaxID=765257 RepID=A0A0C9ZYY0_9AGAM|nr:hypothetical protein PISMIDRAFT_674767 [Pisolithus microcarpus 441]
MRTTVGIFYALLIIVQAACASPQPIPEPAAPGARTLTFGPGPECLPQCSPECWCSEGSA